MPWEVRLWSDVESWLLEVGNADFDLIAAAIDHLEANGPTVGRPSVDRVKGSRHHNMKELRPGSSSRSEIRILFAFDPWQEAILLVAGDKRGQWKRWYDDSIPLADDRFDEWQKQGREGKE